MKALDGVDHSGITWSAPLNLYAGTADGIDDQTEEQAFNLATDTAIARSGARRG